MTKKTLLQNHLAPSIAKALAKVIFQVPVISDPLIDFLNEHLKGRGEAKQAERQIDRLVDQCLAPLTPLFTTAKDINPEAVALALGETVEQHINVQTLVAGDLDRKRIHAKVMVARPLDDLKKEAYGEANINFYRRTLPLLLDRLITIAPKLDGFVGASAAEILSRLTKLADDTASIRRSTEKIERWIDRQEKPLREYAADYCGYMKETLDVVQLFGMPADTAVKRQRLSTAFIPLSLSQGGADDDTPTSGYLETLLNRLSPQHPYLLITGPAGAGKTTLMRWAAIEAARLIGDEDPSDALKRWEARNANKRQFLGTPENLGLEQESRPAGEFWRFRVPFLIPLRDCAGGRLPKPDEYPQIGTRYQKGPPDGWVQSILDEGQALVLIDGIDEVAHRNRDELQQQLTGLCRSFAGNYLVFTTRPGVIGEDWFADLDMMRAEVNPLTEHDRTALIEHWHEAAADKIEGDAKAIAAELIEKLRRSPEIAQLGTNPLLAAAICALHHAREGYLPKKQADLCKRLCELLIHQRDLERRIAALQDDSDFGLLDYDHKERLVQAMALEALRGGEPILAADVADGLIGDMLQGFDLEKPLAPDYVRKELVERAGVLREAYGSGVDFAHNTLRDFLAGQAFVHERNGPKELARNASDQAWHRPIIFAAGAGSQDFARILIEALIRRGSRMAKILAILCDQAVTFLDQQLRARVKGLLDDVLPPNNTDEAALLAALGDDIVDKRLQRKRPKAMALACARTLRLIGTEKAKEAVRFYWDTDQQEIAEELAQVFNPLALPFWQKKVQQEPNPGEPNLPDGVALGVKDLAPLQGLAGLQYLSLNNTPVADLAPLKGLAGLQGLFLNDTQVTDLAPLKGLAGLEYLYLDNTQVADLAPLKGLVGLHTLFLNDTQVTDLAPLKGLAGLEYLSLNNTPVADLAPLQGLAGLHTLFLNDIQVTDLAPLKGLAGLEYLSLAGTPVADLAPLAGLVGLQRLSLAGTPVADVSVLDHIEGLEIHR